MWPHFTPKQHIFFIFYTNSVVLHKNYLLFNLPWPRISICCPHHPAIHQHQQSTNPTSTQHCFILAFFPPCHSCRASSVHRTSSRPPSNTPADITNDTRGVAAAANDNTTTVKNMQQELCHRGFTKPTKALHRSHDPASHEAAPQGAATATAAACQPAILLTCARRQCAAGCTLPPKTSRTKGAPPQTRASHAAPASCQGCTPGEGAGRRPGAAAQH